MTLRLKFCTVQDFESQDVIRVQVKRWSLNAEYHVHTNCFEQLDLRRNSKYTSTKGTMILLSPMSGNGISRYSIQLATFDGYRADIGRTQEAS